MKFNAYAVRDEKAARYNPPFYMASHPEAMRAFGENVQKEHTLWFKYPDDFRLYLVGTFDDETGHCESDSIPLLLASARDYKPANLPPAPEIKRVEDGLNHAGERYVKPSLFEEKPKG